MPDSYTTHKEYKTGDRNHPYTITADHGSHTNTTGYSRPIDVICQHTRDGALIPIKIRIQDDEGEFQTYMVKAYKDLSHKGEFTLPNGVIATHTILPFECIIHVFGREKHLRIYYNVNDCTWRLAGEYS